MLFSEFFTLLFLCMLAVYSLSLVCGIVVHGICGNRLQKPLISNCMSHSSSLVQCTYLKSNIEPLATSSGDLNTIINNNSLQLKQWYHCFLRITKIQINWLSVISKMLCERFYFGESNRIPSDFFLSICYVTFLFIISYSVDFFPYSYIFYGIILILSRFNYPTATHSFDNYWKWLNWSCLQSHKHLPWNKLINKAAPSNRNVVFFNFLLDSER